MRMQSSVFHAGKHIEDTLLTVVGQTYEGTWSTVKCRCECGNVVDLPYQRVYYRQFSCGCTRRIRSNAVDYADYSVINSVGNHHKGRTLTIIDRDTETQQWQYVCACCAQIFLMPRGNERGVVNSLNKLAGLDCPNWLPFTYVDHIENITWQRPCDRYMFDPMGREGAAKALVPFYDPKNIKYARDGVIVGFYGPPAKPLPDAWLKKRYAPTQEPVAMDPDGFESMFDGDSGSGVESTGAR